jgi:hypothetical protein
MMNMFMMAFENDRPPLRKKRKKQDGDSSSYLNIN